MDNASGARLALLDLPRPLAFVFSGGGGAGATQVGMLRALHETGLEPDVIVGASVGALNGVLVAERGIAGAIDPLYELWTSMNRRALFGPAHHAAANLLRRRHAGSVPRLLRLISDNLEARTFDDLAHPFVAVATDSLTGSAVCLSEGDLVSALLASTALPGVFPAHTHEGRLYLDGGVAANLPIRLAVTGGAASVVALDAVAAPSEHHQPKTGPRNMIAATRIMLRSQAAHDLTAVEVPTVLLPPATPADVGAFDFRRTDELVERGYARTVEFLSAEDPTAGR